MSGVSESSTQIHDELLAEVKLELERRGTSQIVRKPAIEQDAIAGFAVTTILTCLALLAGTGVAMAVVYVPSMEDANASTAWFQSGALGAVIRAIHWHASNLLIVLSAAYLGYLAWKGLFRRPGQWRWWRAALLLALVLGFSLTGQTLPADQNALHGTAIRLSYLAELPVLGELLRHHVQGGDSIGSATLARIFGLHALVFPALTVILLRWLWKDGETENSLTPHFGVAGAVAAIVTVVSVLVAAPLGLQGNLSVPYPEARPEWFALPLYAILKIVPPGALHILFLFLPPLLGAAAVVALPFIEKAADQPARLRKPIQIGLIASVAMFLIFAAVPLIQDMSDHEGWFRNYSPEDIMTAMGERNAELRNSAEPLPEDAHNPARDIALLHESLVGNYPEKIEDAQKADWDKFAHEGAAAARKLLRAPDAESQQAARQELRKACEGCHKQHDKEEVRIDPPPVFGVPAVKKDPEPKSEFFFKQDELATLKPTEIPKRLSTTKLMDQMKYRIKDILIEAGALTDNRDPEQEHRTREQALVDLISLTGLVEDYYEKNAGSFYDEAKWKKWVENLHLTAVELAKAKDPADVGKKAAAVGKACETCHSGADDLDEPIEWTFRSMLAGED